VKLGIREDAEDKGSGQGSGKSLVRRTMMVEFQIHIK
jgi:hypothetical protein